MQKLRISDWDKCWAEVQKEAWKILKSVLTDTEIISAAVRGLKKKVMDDARAYGLIGFFPQDKGMWSSVSFTRHQSKKSQFAYPVH